MIIVAVLLELLLWMGNVPNSSFFSLSLLLSYVACMHMPRATLFYLYLKNKETEEESLRNLPNVIQLLSESSRNQTQCVLILYDLLTKL